MLSLLPEVIPQKKATFLSSQLAIFILVTWTPWVDFSLLSWYSTNVNSLIKSSPDISIMLPAEPLRSSHNEIFLKSWSPKITCMFRPSKVGICVYATCVYVCIYVYVCICIYIFVLLNTYMRDTHIHLHTLAHFLWFISNSFSGTFLLF